MIKIKIHIFQFFPLSQLKHTISTQNCFIDGERLLSSQYGFSKINLRKKLVDFYFFYLNFWFLLNTLIYLDARNLQCAIPIQLSPRQTI